MQPNLAIVGEAIKIDTGAAANGAIEQDSYGVLVGWGHEEFNGRLDLKVQSAHSLYGRKLRDIHTNHLMLTRNQALLLGNYLLTISGQSPPLRRKRGWFRRLLGG